jgi:gluconolactonase
MLTRYLTAMGSGTALALALLITPLAFAEEAKTKEVEVKDIKLDVPETWKAKPLPPNGFRAAQFEIPAAEGDKEGGELVVFHFGPNGGGGVQANVDRWVKQFEAEERKLKIFDGKTKQGEYILVDLTGTWNKPVGPPIAMKTTKAPGSRFLGVILKPEKGGDYYIRLTGPEKTVTENAKNFRVAIKADLETEKEKKQDDEKKKE